MVLLGAFLDKINVKSEENAMKNRVKELRDAKHLTQTGLALKVGSTQQTISKIEREIGVPKLDLALIMADFFNVTLEYLFCLSDKKHKLEHQIEIDKTIEEFYDFFVDYQDLNSENKETLSCGSRVHIVLKGKLYKFYKKLDDVEKEISVNYSIPFIRIHKSYLVNFQQIRKVGYTEVETKDGRILNISDTYKKDVRARYSKLLWDGDV